MTKIASTPTLLSPASLPRFIRDKVIVAENGCWLWTKSKNSGYGQVWVPELQKLRLVHVVAYEALVGPVPPGYDVGHICHDEDLACPGGECAHRACCFPEHLSPQTRTQNNLGGRLGEVQRARHAEVTRCPQGHPYDEANTYWRHDRPTGGRQCRACHRDRSRERRLEEDLRAAFGRIDPQTGEILDGGDE